MKIWFKWGSQMELESIKARRNREIEVYDDVVHMNHQSETSRDGPILV